MNKITKKNPGKLAFIITCLADFVEHSPVI